jgi:hypothetical protein
VGEFADKWGIPTEEVAVLQEANRLFDESIHKVGGSEKTATVVSIKNARRKQLVRIIRTLTGFRLRNPVISDADRLRLGLHVADRTPTPPPVAESHPLVKIDTSLLAHLTFHFYGKRHSAHNSKPPGQHGVEIGWVICPSPVTRLDELIHSAFSTKPSFSLTFAHNQRGQRVCCAFRWENTRGEKGPWSMIMEAFIP